MSDWWIEYCDEDTETVFRWHGGEYAEVGYMNDNDANGEGTFFHAVDTINVWDYEKEQSTFETDADDDWQGRKYVGRPFRHILEAFELRCQQYLDEVSQDA